MPQRIQFYLRFIIVKYVSTKIHQGIYNREEEEEEDKRKLLYISYNEMVQSNEKHELLYFRKCLNYYFVYKTFLR